MSLRETIFQAKIRLGSGGGYGELHRQLHEAERLDPERLADLQRQRTAELAQRAARTTQWYETLYRDHAADLAALARDPEALGRLPVVEKSDVRLNKDAFIARGTDLANTRLVRTGGSTGEPLHLLHDTRIPTTTLGWRFWEWWGVQPGDNVALLERPRRFGRQKVLHEAKWWPTRRIHLDAGRMIPETIDTFKEEWRRTRPRLLVGYAGALHEFARLLESSGEQLPTPVAISFTAAPLPTTQRGDVERVLGAPAYDTYRAAEVPNMAAECAEQNGLHVSSDLRVIEIVDDAGRPVPPGQEGDIVVTDLLNTTFPLIRYRLGDRARMLEGTCACGRPFPRISPITGRITDTLRLPSGKALADGMMGLFVTPGMTKQYQIHQLADYSVDVRVVLGDHPDARAENERIVAVIRERFEGQVPVRMQAVDSIPHDRGKLRLVISDVESPA